MRSYAIVIASIFGQLMAQIPNPSGEYCGSFKNAIVDGSLTVNVKSENAFDISGSLSIAGAGPNTAEATDVPYTFDSSAGTFTVTDLAKVEQFLKDLKAPISSSALGTFKYDGKGLSTTALAGYQLTNAACKRLLRA